MGALHVLAPAIRRTLPVTTHAATSLGGGIAAAYVFPYLLPRLAEATTVAHVLEEVRATPTRGFVLFLVALVSFFTFYALEPVTTVRTSAGSPPAGPRSNSASSPSTAA